MSGESGGWKTETTVLEQQLKRMDVGFWSQIWAQILAQQSFDYVIFIMYTNMTTSLKDSKTFI